MRYKKSFKNKFLVLLLVMPCFMFLQSCENKKDSNNKHLFQNVATLPSKVGESNYEQSVLNIKAIVEPDQQINLSSLQVCDDSQCWDVLGGRSIDNAVVAEHSIRAAQAQTYPPSDSVIPVGSFVADEIAEGVDRIKYVYKEKKGELNLETKITFNKGLQSYMYLNLGETVSVPFTTLSIKNGRNGLYIPNLAFRKEFASGVIIEVEKDSSSQMGHLYIGELGHNLYKNFEISSYLIYFYSTPVSFNELTEIENDFPKKFTKPITIYIPFNYSGSDIDEVKDKYSLYLNDYEKEFEVISKNSEYYITFESLDTYLKVLFFDKRKIL